MAFKSGSQIVTQNNETGISPFYYDAGAADASYSYLVTLSGSSQGYPSALVPPTICKPYLDPVCISGTLNGPWLDIISIPYVRPCLKWTDCRPRIRFLYNHPLYHTIPAITLDISAQGILYFENNGISTELTLNPPPPQSIPTSLVDSSGIPFIPLVFNTNNLSSNQSQGYPTFTGGYCNIKVSVGSNSPAHINLTDASGNGGPGLPAFKWEYNQANNSFNTVIDISEQLTPGSLVPNGKTSKKKKKFLTTNASIAIEITLNSTPSSGGTWIQITGTLSVGFLLYFRKYHTTEYVVTNATLQSIEPYYKPPPTPTPRPTKTPRPSGTPRPSPSGTPKPTHTPIPTPPPTPIVIIISKTPLPPPTPFVPR